VTRSVAAVAIVSGALGAGLLVSVWTWWWDGPFAAWELGAVLTLLCVPLGIGVALYAGVRRRLCGLPLAAGVVGLSAAGLIVFWIVEIYRHIGPDY
jgi:hypothetical protein